MPPKLRGHDFWKETLKGAKHVVAPMVDQSELAWRIFSRRHGAELCYTPMLHANVFIRDPRYRKENFVSCAEDRPLVVQFCANDPEVLLEAVKLVYGQCEAVDLNLGCPQTIAKKGHYGAFLQDEWKLIHEMVRLVYNEIDIPITCKIRVFEDIGKSVQYAQMLEAAGCQLLTVHGRTREQKGPLTGIASWEHIRAIKAAVKIPIFANGNIQYYEDIERCLRETGAEGIMTAEGNLYNPALFQGKRPTNYEMAEEYLSIVQQYPCSMSYVRGHLFKLFHDCLTIPEFCELRDDLAKAGNLEIFIQIVQKLKEKLINMQNSNFVHSHLSSDPPWICQPYVRPGPDSKPKNANRRCNILNDGISEKIKSELSNRKLKKLQRNPRKTFVQKRISEYQLCKQCSNPKGTQCAYECCKKCCKLKCYHEVLDCKGHKFTFHTKKLLKVT